MGILSRVVRLCKADLHGVMDQMEDKELLLKQHMREMQAVIADRQARIDQLEAVLGRAQKDMMRYNKHVQALAEDRDRAVAGNKDDIARLLIRKLHPLRLTVAHMEARIKSLTDERVEAQERLAAQTMTYDAIRLRVAAVRERSRSAIGMLEALPTGGAWRQQEPSEEEIEWELFQRKEATGSGRTP